ncbi:hypothetical protein HZA56_06280 [Candidatus Poribacteria bacterium]|nr:hypothetical protein [Candidatus Poribacteria bacterium]
MKNHNTISMGRASSVPLANKKTEDMMILMGITARQSLNRFLQIITKSDNLLKVSDPPGKMKFRVNGCQRREKDYAYKRRSGSHENLA